MAEENKVTSKKLERIYTVPFGKAYDYLRTRRTRRAMKLLRAFLSRHFKVKDEAVRISQGVNDAMWRDGIQKPPRSLKIRGVFEDGKLTAWMIGEEEKVKKAMDEKKAAEEKMKKEREAKAKKEAKPEKKEEKKEAAKESKPEAAKPAAPAVSKTAEPRAGDVKPMPKTSGGPLMGRKQI
ncbi:MAG: 50S ribosomal protein L31e [Candidatus Marsarchaeota archaeon]|nr:50S ribosomal protein L31e [Candidatus Marsarchaeota archaeon]